MADYTIIVPNSAGSGWRALDLVSGDRVLIESVQVANLETTTQLIAPSGAAFPGAPATGEIFWRSDEQTLYRYSGAAWEAVKGDEDWVTETLGDVTGDPHGFLNQTDTTISFDDGTLTFTIAPVGANFSYYYQGAQVTKLASENKVITNTDGLHFIYYDAAAALQDSLTPWNLETHVPIATVHWNTTTTEGELGEERHTVTLDWRTHLYLHRANGTRYIDGLTVSGYVLNSDNDNDVTIGVSDGTIYDEDISIDIKHAAVPSQFFEQILADPAQIPVYYREGASGYWRKDTATTFYFKNTAAGMVNWNEDTGATWQQTEATNGYHVAYWLFATNHVENPVIALQGQRQDNNLPGARENNTLPNFTFGTLPFQEMKVLYRIILQTSTSFGGTRKAKIQDVADFRSITNLPAGSFVPITHASLGDLSTSGHPADVLDLDTTNFNGILSATDTEVQTAMETIDDVRTIGAAAPGSPYDGQIWYDNTAGERILYVYDGARTKWLSAHEFALGWGHDSGDGELLKGYGIDVAGTGTGVLMPKDATITRISCRQRSGPDPKRFDILVNGASVFNFNAVTNVYKNNSANIDLSENDNLWIEVDSTGTAAQDVAVILWLAWRG